MKKKSRGISGREGEARWYIHHEKMLITAKQLGFESIDSAILNLYRKHHSMKVVADIFGVIRETIRRHLKRLRVINIRKRGGSVRNNTGIFIVDCNDGVRRRFVAGVVSPMKKFSNLRCTHCHAILKNIKSTTCGRTVQLLKYHCCDDIPNKRILGKNKVKVK